MYPNVILFACLNIDNNLSSCHEDLISFIIMDSQSSRPDHNVLSNITLCYLRQILFWGVTFLLDYFTCILLHVKFKLFLFYFDYMESS